MNKKLLSDAISYGNDSFHTVRLILRNITVLPKDTALTLLVIADHLPNSFPSKAKIAELTGRHIRTVRRDIIALEKSGILKVTRRHGHSSVYKINTKVLQGRDMGVPIASKVGTSVSPGGGHGCPHGRDMGVPHKIQPKIQIKIGDDFKNLSDEEIDPDMINPETRSEWLMKNLFKK